MMELDRGDFARSRASHRVDRLIERSRTVVKNFHPRQEKLYKAYKKAELAIIASERGWETDDPDTLEWKLKDAKTAYLFSLEKDTSIDWAFRDEIAAALEAYLKTDDDIMEGVIQKHLPNDVSEVTRKEEAHQIVEGQKIRKRLDRLIDRSLKECKSYLKSRHIELYNDYLRLYSAYGAEIIDLSPNPSLDLARTTYLSELAKDMTIPRYFRRDIRYALQAYDKILTRKKT